MTDPRLDVLTRELASDLDRIADAVAADATASRQPLPAIYTSGQLTDDTHVRLEPAWTYLADRWPAVVAAANLGVAEVRHNGESGTHVAVTIVADEMLCQVLLHDTDGRWHATSASAPTSSCIVADAGPQLPSHVLVAAAAEPVPIVAHLRWLDADTHLRRHVTVWHGDDDPNRGALYRAQAACGHNDQPAYRTVEQARADLAQIGGAPTFRRRWPHAHLPPLTANTPTGTRAITAFDDDGVAVEIAVTLGAATRSTLLHELAHVLTPDADEHHGSEFLAVFLQLIADHDSVAAADELVRALAAEGVAVPTYHAAAGEHVATAP